MDIASLYHVSSGAVREAVKQTGAMKNAEAAKEGQDIFSTMLHTAIDNEELKLALGETKNTHDLSIAMQKASEALQYTVAVRDKFLDAYKEIMQMQI